MDAYSTLIDVRDALNWEASGRNTSTWSNYFYLAVTPGNLSASQLHTYVKSDLYNSQVPLIVSVNENVLPDWSGSSGSHLIAITGYDDNAGTYTYSETCDRTGVACNTQVVGHYNIGQQLLYSGIQNDNGNGGIVW